MLVNLCSWRSPVVHRGWDPSLFVVVSVFLGGRRNFLQAHQCTCQCHHSFMPAGSCQALVLGHQSGVGIPGHFLGVLVHWDQGMLSAYIGRPVPPWVFDCPPARGSLVLAVTFAFPRGSANCWHTRQTMRLYRRSWVLAGCFFFFGKARPPGHLSGVCGPLPLFFLLSGNSTSAGLELGLVNRCSDGFGCPHTCGPLVFCCTICVHWRVCNYYAHAPVIPLRSVFLHVRSVLCNTGAGASIRGLCSPALGYVHRAAATVHALKSYR